jgi:hypothetical protein
MARYVIRMAVRVEGYITHLIQRANAEQQGDASRFVRGLTHRASMIAVLKDTQAHVRAMLHGKVYRLLESWIDKAAKAEKVAVACELHAHMASLFKNVELAELTAQGVRALVLANLYSTYSPSCV